MTAGVNFNNSRVDATGTSETTLIINGRQFSAAGEAVYATIAWPSVMPYLGIGYGHALSFKGWRMFGDLGVIPTWTQPVPVESVGLEPCWALEPARC